MSATTYNLNLDPISTAQLTGLTIAALMLVCGLISLIIVQKIHPIGHSGFDDGLEFAKPLSLVVFLVICIIAAVASLMNTPGCADSNIRPLLQQDQHIEQLRAERDILNGKIKLYELEQQPTKTQQ